MDLSFMPNLSLSMEDRDFLRLVVYMRDNYGINLEKKRALVEGRLLSLVTSEGYTSYHEYINDALSDKSGYKVGKLVARLTTNYTYFMREFQHFNFLKTTALPQLKSSIKDKDLRSWSAGCSSGEEAYTAAMLYDEFFALERQDWDISILATDISTHMLAKASAGVFSTEKLKDIPESWQRRNFTKLAGDNWELKHHIRREVIFRELNLMGSFAHFRKKFHVIFCRNVMIYFDQQTRVELTQKFWDVLEPGGYFFIGLSETLTGINKKFKQIAPSIYIKE